MIMWFHLVLFVTSVIIHGASCEEESTDGEFAMKYLSDYHYLSPSRSGNHDVKTALRNFQKFFGLPLTGELDEETLYEMKKPRCGVPDVDENGGRLRIKRFSTWGKWRKTDLKYYLSFGEDMSEADQARVMARAFQMWSAVASKLRFTRTLSVSNADFRISFGKRKHSGVPGERQCYSDFDGKGKVLAHAFYPQDGRLHFDDDEYFTATGSWWNGSQSLLYVAVHEIGHALGLRHSDVKGTVMWPTASRGTPKLHQDDIDGIRSLYGMWKTLKKEVDWEVFSLLLARLNSVIDNLDTYFSGS